MKCSRCDRDNLTEQELELHTKVFHKPKVSQPPQKIATGVCPDCGSTLWYMEGCATCQTCGFSKCN